MKIKYLFAICALGALSVALVGCDPEKAAGEPEEEAGMLVGTNGAILLDDFKPSGEPIKLAPEDGDEVAVMETDEGRIVLMFHPEVAPDHVANFKKLVREGFYDGTRFHRTIKKFMIQGGDPMSKSLDLANYWGTGDYVDDEARLIQLVAEFNDIKHVRGVLSMSRSDNADHTASCQFFIVQQDALYLDGDYSAFGRVVEGLDVVDKIVMTPTKDDDATVFTGRAVTLTKITIETWPLSE